MTWKPLETRHHHVSGARGDSGADASHRTAQAWMDSREKTAREGTPEPKNDKSSQLQANKEQSPFKTARDGTPEPENEKSGPAAGRKEQPLRERADLQLVKRA